MNADKPKVGFQCASCGQYHDHLPMEFGANVPTMYNTIPQAERESRCELTDDICVIDSEFFFILIAGVSKIDVFHFQAFDQFSFM